MLQRKFSSAARKNPIDELQPLIDEAHEIAYNNNFAG
jgi:hypothetical protein